MIPTPSKFKAVSTRATAYIENTRSCGQVEQVYDEIYLAYRSLRKTIMEILLTQEITDGSLEIARVLHVLSSFPVYAAVARPLSGFYLCGGHATVILT